MLWVIGQVIIALVGMAALILGVVAIWYGFGYLVLLGVSRLMPLTGRTTRKRGKG